MKLTNRLKIEALAHQKKSGIKGKTAFNYIFKKIKTAYYNLSDKDREACIKEWEENDTPA